MRSFRPRARSVRRPLLICATGAIAAITAVAPVALPAGTAAEPDTPGAAARLAPRLAAPGAADAPGDPGWHVADLGSGRYEVSWTARADLPIGADRPTIAGHGLAFGAPEIGADGRTVTSVVTSPTAPTPAGLDVWLSGDRLDEPGFDPTVSGAAEQLPNRATAPLDAPDPAAPGPYETVTSEYTWDPVKLPRMRAPIEMIGHVVEPVPGADTGPRPLVLFMHGRHSVCYNPTDPEDYDDAWPCEAPMREIPGHLGYDYIQQALASQGYTTVSVRVNGINAQDHRLDDGGADARAAIVQEHLDGWVTMAEEHQVDLDQVILVGHSRGGEGVDRASIQIPLSAPYRIAGQVLLAPVDFAYHTAPYVPTVTVLPYCDGDVYDIQGQRFTDTARDLAADDTSLKSSVLVMGANHNFFNTEWTPGTAVAPSWDDWGGDKDATCGRRDPGRLSAREQRNVGTAYVAGAVHLFTGDDGYLPMYDGSPVDVPSIGDADVLSHAIGGGRDLRRPGSQATPTLPSGGAETRVCTGVTPRRGGSFALCGRDVGNRITPHWASYGEKVPTRKFLQMSWDGAGATAGLRLRAPLDLSSDRLELRTILDPRFRAPDVQVRIGDAAGGSALLDPVAGTEPVQLPKVSYATKMWAQALVVDASGADGVDLTEITTVELVAGNARGRLWVADLAAAPDTLAAVPATRLPQIDVGNVEVDEGDDHGRHVLEVPFRVEGEVTAPGRFVAFTAGESRGTSQRLVIDVAPGQTSGYIPVEYVADELDSSDRWTQVSVWPLSGVATDDYLGRAIVVDDDPAPRIRVTARPRTIVEGDGATFTVTLDVPSGEDMYIVGRVVRGSGAQLRGADVPAAWLRSHAQQERPRLPLWKARTYVFSRLRSGETKLSLTIPTRRDGIREGREVVALRFHLGDRRVTRSVAVVER